MAERTQFLTSVGLRNQSDDREIAGFNPEVLRFRDMLHFSYKRQRKQRDARAGNKGYEKATVCAKDASKVREALHKAENHRKAEKPSQGSEAIVSMYKSSKQHGA